eukprot:4538258-Prymnesium_polylepis.1
MLGSFEDLLNGIVSDEADGEEEELPCNSRFARFFTKGGGSAAPSASSAAKKEPEPPATTPLGSLGGLKLEPEPEDDWQQG